MRDFRDAKVMAQTLREALHAKSVSFTHSESQELIAKILGFRELERIGRKDPGEPADRDDGASYYLYSSPERASPFFLCAILCCFRT